MRESEIELAKASAAAALHDTPLQRCYVNLSVLLDSSWRHAHVVCILSRDGTATK
jgi:hypothetical protein